MDRDEAARAFLAKIHGLVSDYTSGNAPAGPLRSAIRRMWAEERVRRAATGLDTGTIRLFALRQYADIDLSWPVEKPPSVQTLQGALKEILELCDDSRSGANGSSS
ncbi:MAG: hypothetical protein AB7E79_13735 [Rhodospirillaceae bacterium]